MKLYIMRHGQARPMTQDPQRGLTEIGQADCLRMADFLKKQSISVAEVCHSNKLRAIQTAKIMAEKICPSDNIGERDGLTPDSSPMVLAKRIMNFSQDTLLVSHLPLVSYVLSNLLNLTQNECVANFEPASIACLQRVDQYHWQLDWLLSAALLR